jgi:cysteine desulfuration protein SufE
MTINSIQDEIIEEFNMFDDWMDRYEYIIELGKDLPIIEEQYKIDDNLIKGCQSKVWLHATLNDGVIEFTAASDAIITKGIIALFVRVLSGFSAQEILDADLYFVDKIGLKEHLSPTRANGLVSMIKQLKMYALAYTSKK